MNCLYFVARGTLDDVLWKLLEKKFRDLGKSEDATAPSSIDRLSYIHFFKTQVSSSRVKKS